MLEWRSIPYHPRLLTFFYRQLPARRPGDWGSGSVRCCFHQNAVSKADSFCIENEQADIHSITTAL